MMQDTNINIKTFTTIASALQSPFARLAVRRPATMSILFRVPLGFDIMIPQYIYIYEYDYKVRTANGHPNIVSKYQIDKSVCNCDFRITVNKTEVSTYVCMEQKI